MPIIIPKKSKEPETPAKTGIGLATSIEPTCVLYIDKLSVVLNPVSQTDAMEFRKGVYQALNDKEVFQSAKGTGRYKVERNIAFPGTEQRAFFQFEPKHNGLPWCRLEFNPRKLGEPGMEQLHAVLGTCFESGWGYFFQHGRVTRADIALRVNNIRMDDFLMLKSTGVTSREYRRDGHVQTIYLGKPNGNSIKIYDKNAQRCSQGKVLDKNTVHIEASIRNPPPKTVSMFYQATNPFLSLVAISNAPKAPVGEKYSAWCSFLDSIAVRGLTAALALVPSQRRTVYRKHLKANPLTWWQPVEMWKLWPEAVALLDLNLT